MSYFFIIMFLILLDLSLKEYVKSKYKIGEEINIYKNRIFICYTKNKGLAYGFLKNCKKTIYFIIIISIFLISVLFYFAFKEKSILKKLAFSFALGGALGNFIDRIKNKAVTDYIYIKAKKAPIFNLADIFLLISIVLIFIKDIIMKK